MEVESVGVAAVSAWRIARVSRSPKLGLHTNQAGLRAMPGVRLGAQRANCDGIAPKTCTLEPLGTPLAFRQSLSLLLPPKGLYPCCFGRFPLLARVGLIVPVRWRRSGA